MKSLAAALLAVIAAAVLFSAPSSSEGRRLPGAPAPMRPPVCLQQPQPNVTGKYDSNWDGIELRQEGKRVTGTYECCGGGRIDGTITGNVIRYRWWQSGVDGGGRGVWVIATTGELIGSWGAGNDEVGGGAWNLRRTTGAVARAK